MTMNRPDQQGKQQDQRQGTHQPQLLTDDGKDHIVLRLRHEAQLLHAAAQPLAENTAGADGVQPLDCLVALLIIFRMPPDHEPLQAVAFHAEKNRHQPCACGPHEHKGHIPGRGKKNQQKPDAQDDDGGA